MTTAVATPALSKKDKAFRTAHGHLPTECARGCYRLKGRGTAKVEVHRDSLGRPGTMRGQPFTETFAEKQERKALKRAGNAPSANGPVVTVAPVVVTPAEQALADTISKAVSKAVALALAKALAPKA